MTSPAPHLPPPALPPGKKQNLFVRLLRSPYILIAVLIHLLLLAGFGGKVVFQAMVRKSEFDANGDLVQMPNAGAPPPPALQQAPPPDETMPVPTNPSTTPNDVIASNVLSPDSFQMPTAIPLPNAEVSPVKAVAKAAPPAPSNFAQRAAAVRDMTKGWGADGETGPTGTGKSTKAKFVCYVARAEGIKPESYHVLDPAGNIKGGPVPNMLRMINAWSNGRITAETVARPLSLSSDELFTKKPPFVYLAGFTDFVLTEAEVQNLRKYLVSGGAVWGDNGLAGKGSRFDIAFRREMKRVIPDEDKPFEVLPPDHPIFRGAESFYQLSGVPPGMNFRAEPVEGIKIDGELAVVYTPNDYTDMMTMAYAPPLKADHNVPEPVNRNGPNIYWVTPRFNLLMTHNKNYFRNFEPESCEDVFQLSTNIVVHLLIRFQQKLLFTP